MRKRKVSYPPARTATKRAPAPGVVGGPLMVRPTVATINMQARAGRGDIKTGDRVRIVGPGLYSGENGVVESVVGGVIPAALVRTDAGRSRRVRTVDLEPISEPMPAEPAPPTETTPSAENAET